MNRCASASTSTMSPRCGTRAAATIPIRCARPSLAEKAGADGITAHLREDRRHISDDDIARLSRESENSAQSGNGRDRRDAGHRAQGTSPHAACIVPEKREERTTEGGIDAVGHFARLEAHRRDAWPRPASAFPCSSSPTASSSTPAARWARRWWNCTPAPMPMPAARTREELLTAHSQCRRVRRRSSGLKFMPATA